MLCENCQERPATVHETFTETSMGRQTTRNLRSVCAEGEAYVLLPGPPKIIVARREITTGELADALGKPLFRIIAACVAEGVLATANRVLERACEMISGR